MNSQKRSLRAFALLMISYAVLTLIYILPIDNILMLYRTTSVFYFFPAVFILIYFATRIIDKRVRKYLSAVGIMIVFWCVLRAAKYIAFEENESIARFIWYLYYVPMLMIPQFSFQAALSVGKQEKQKLPVIQRITGIIAVICIAIILTNDLHQKVFRFHTDFTDWDSDYERKMLFWIITIWDYLFFLLSTAVLFRKSRLSESRKLSWIPVLYLCFGVIGLYLLNTGKLLRICGATIGEFPDMACYTLGGFWILCITIGLVPSNISYEKIFQETSLSAEIANIDYEIVYKSSTAVSLNNKQLSKSEPFMFDENTIIRRKNVSGGYVYWKTDISELNDINRELKEAKLKIEEEAEIINKTNQLKERQAQINAKSKAYDEIAKRVLPQSQKIAVLSSEISTNSERFTENMRLIAVLAVYIKRMSNMMILSSEGKMSKRELLLAFSESSRYLNKAGIITEVIGNMDESGTNDNILIGIYERFEILLEQALPNLKALYITLSEDVVKLNFEGVTLSIPENWNGTAETDDNITFVRLYLNKGGDMI